MKSILSYLYDLSFKGKHIDIAEYPAAPSSGKAIEMHASEAEKEEHNESQVVLQLKQLGQFPRKLPHG